MLLPRHDQNVCLWRHGAGSVDLVRMWELERISGQKHHHQPLYTVEPVEAFLGSLLAEEGLGLDRVSRIWGTPGLPRSVDLPIPAGAEDFPLHSLGHLFSGLLLDTRMLKEETIVAIATDAAPDFALERTSKPYWYAGYVSRRGTLTFAPVQSPAAFYSAGEQVFDAEPGTLMALAGACAAELEFDIEARLAGMSLLGGMVHPVSETVPLVLDMLAEAERQLDRSRLDTRFTGRENHASAVMKVIQRGCEHLARRNVEMLCARAGVRPQDSYLSTSGGFSLNCPTNSALVDSLGFRDLLAPPCANDAGQAYGLGLLGPWASGAFTTADHKLGSAYHGPQVTDLDDARAEFAPWMDSVTTFDPDEFVRDVCAGPVAWVDGAAEIGPRAPCHRSLLGDPRSMATKQALNDCKGRQWWRPVAPVVLEEHAAQWFSHGRPSPYMLETAEVRPEVRDRVPAILHLDGSARHQTLTDRVNPLLHRALVAFRAATGVPMLCNTSLNDKGEPIIDTAAAALTFCLRKRIRVAYVCGRRVALVPHAPSGAARPDRPRPRRTAYFSGQEAQRDAFWVRWTGAGYTESAMFLLSQLPAAPRPGPGPPGRRQRAGRPPARDRPVLRLLGAAVPTRAGRDDLVRPGARAAWLGPDGRADRRPAAAAAPDHTARPPTRRRQQPLTVLTGSTAQKGPHS